MKKDNFISSLEQACSAADIAIKMLSKADDETVQGNIWFRNSDVLVKFDTEEETPLVADFTILVPQLKKLLSHFDEENYEAFIRNASHQVVSEAYGQSDISGSELEKECVTFQNNMNLKSIEVYPDAFMLIYDINDDDALLYLQLDDTYSIEDMMIE